MTSGAAPYYAYFGAHAGPAGQGYYSYDLPNRWHVIVLNAICSDVGGCTSGPQAAWLKADLAANAGRHLIAMWHIPEFSSGGLHGNTTVYQGWWQDLYAAGADIVLNGHDHDFERFAKQGPTGIPSANGIREFVVGTGGAGTRAFGTIRANSEARSLDLGVLELTLRDDSYSWQFISSNGSFTDSGTTATNNP
jgi:acid phosphatase type 7